MDREHSPILVSAPHTPVRMNSIEEEEDQQPTGTADQASGGGSKGVLVNSGTHESLLTVETPPRRPNSFYSVQGGNNSSSSLVATKGFTFGGSGSGVVCGSELSNINVGGGKKHSLKYIPGPKLPPISRNRSPVRTTRSPSPDRVGKRSSVLLETPFNFNSSSMQPPPLSGSSNSSMNGSRNPMFRKGHRYKHSSVSMNFFQEPEVKEPLNIIQSLPVPNFKDLSSNLIWPKTHVQLSIVFVETLVAVYVFNMGQFKEWSTMSTLAHLLTYDVLGSIFSILTELLSQFEIWKTGTITLPFGLNRIDVLLSFAFSISICFVGLDLLFHVLEEFVVLFAESNTKEHHDEINQTIPHSHHTHVEHSQYTLWYSTIALAAFISFMSYNYIFKTTQYKIKNSLITLSYVFYMTLFPVLSHLNHAWDMVATILISSFIISYGVKVAKWTSTILLMGFSTTSINDSLLFNDDNDIMSKSNDDTDRITLKRSKSTLPVATIINNTDKSKSHYLNPSFVKSRIYDSILSLPLFKSNCSLKDSDLLISKVNFQLFVVLMKIHMKNGSNDDELGLRLSIDKLIKEYLPNAEVTTEIERL